MKNRKKTVLFASSGVLFALFFVLILLVKLLDTAPIGPLDSVIGLSSLNGATRDFFGTSDICYTVTELFGYLAFCVIAIFGGLGFYQLVTRKHLKKVDVDILLLGGLYAVTIACYVLFEIVVINYRPVLVDGVLEASFPSSHTMLVISVFGSAIPQVLSRVKKRPISLALACFFALIIVLTVFGRLASGVHWLTDILGGVLLGAALVLAYAGCFESIPEKM